MEQYEKDLKEFTDATIEALYFTDTGDNGQPAKEAELDVKTRIDLEADCRSFWRRFGCFVISDKCRCFGTGEYSKVAQAGHDFWLTRNGHGCGFWDGDWSETYADMLTEGSKKYGEFPICEGDDGTICGV